ncbi:MAG: hypothetical protein K0Q94_6859 [Paenibacillus sp.]|jgi:hypothetical protein|nr:hypothetical protein [Paenibacillus sp.]
MPVPGFFAYFPSNAALSRLLRLTSVSLFNCGARFHFLIYKCVSIPGIRIYLAIYRKERLEVELFYRFGKSFFV